MRHYRLTIAAVTGLAMGACGVHPASQSPTPAPSPHATMTIPNRETQPEPIRFDFPDCGDDTPPCVTYDDGDQGNGLYMVTSYKPFKAKLYPTCDAEDYPTNLPCIWKHPDAKTGKWIALIKPTS